jgi:hypothetical protein
MYDFRVDFISSFEFHSNCFEFGNEEDCFSYEDFEFITLR